MAFVHKNTTKNKNFLFSWQEQKLKKGRKLGAFSKWSNCRDYYGDSGLYQEEEMRGGLYENGLYETTEKT